MPSTSSLFGVFLLAMLVLARDSFSMPKDGWYNSEDEGNDEEMGSRSDDYHLLDRRQDVNGTNSTTGSSGQTTTPLPSSSTTINGSSSTISSAATTTNESTVTSSTVTSSTVPTASTPKPNGTVDNVIHTGSIFSDKNNPIVVAPFLLPVDAETIAPSVTLPPSIIIPVAYQIPPGGQSAPYGSYFVPQVQPGYNPNFLPNQLPPPPAPYYPFPLPPDRQDPEYPGYPYNPRPIGFPMEGYPPPFKK